MIKSRIAVGFSDMGISLDERMADQFARYHTLLLEWNEKMNLTRIDMDDPEEAIDRHYLDSAAPLLVPGLFEGVHTLIDVGSGAGLPGVPLAILLPKVRVTLLDALQKRVGFLREVIRELGLNAEAVHMRAEDAGQSMEYRERFDMATARAVSGLSGLFELTLPLLRVGGHMIAYKGPSLEEELYQAKDGMAHLGGGAARAYPVSIPGRDWDHRLLIVQKRRQTPKPYPRKPVEMKKRPL